MCLDLRVILWAAKTDKHNIRWFLLPSMWQFADRKPRIIFQLLVSWRTKPWCTGSRTKCGRWACQLGQKHFVVAYFEPSQKGCGSRVPPNEQVRIYGLEKNLLFAFLVLVDLDMVHQFRISTHRGSAVCIGAYYQVQLLGCGFLIHLSKMSNNPRFRASQRKIRQKSTKHGTNPSIPLKSELIVTLGLQFHGSNLTRGLMKLNHAHHRCIIVAQLNREDEGDGGLEFVGGAGCRRRRCGWWSESAVRLEVARKMQHQGGGAGGGEAARWRGFAGGGDIGLG